MFVTLLVLMGLRIMKSEDEQAVIGQLKINCSPYGSYSHNIKLIFKDGCEDFFASLNKRGWKFKYEDDNSSHPIIQKKKKYDLQNDLYLQILAKKNDERQLVFSMCKYDKYVRTCDAESLTSRDLDHINYFLENICKLQLPDGFKEDLAKIHGLEIGESEVFSYNDPEVVQRPGRP